MDHKIDLDAVAVAVALEFRRSSWTASGLTVGPLTWRDADEAWPQPIVTNRDAVNSPESLGITLRGPDDLEADLVLWTGGWADIDGLRNGSLLVGSDPQFCDVQSCLTVVDELVAWLR